MKIIKELIFILCLTTLFVTCNVKTEAKTDTQELQVNEELPVDLTNLEVEITGMTCEIGCAKLIQSKLYKTKGVSFAEVSFEKGNGKITYDANQISNEELKKIIEKIAGGDLYQVGRMDEVVEFSNDDHKADL
jgi:Cu+-exporting ATPase